MRYLLDTNVFIAAMKGVPAVRDALAGVAASDIVVSPIVLGELEFGVSKSAYRESNGQRLAAVMAQLELAPLDAAVSRCYAGTRHRLEQAGQPIGANDLWIAAQALALGATLVSDNLAEFSRVEGLRLANWLRAGD